MDEIGVVTKVDNLFAIVAVERKGACDQCSMGCKVTGYGVELEALNLAHARVGETVRVRMKPYTYLKGSLLVYGLPALALVIGAVLGREMLAMYVTSIDRELLSAIAGFALCLLSFIAVKALSVEAEKKVKYKPVIEEIISK